MGQGILLQSGINELEIVIFRVGNGVFGVNVAKVECIIKYQKITEIPNSNQKIKGVINYRERVIPVLDLGKILNQDYLGQERLFILLNLNNSDFAIEISSVIGIKRLSWQDIETPSNLLSTNAETSLTGIIRLKTEEIILILDLEKILADISPSLALKEASQTNGLEGKKIILAEDSMFLAKIVNESLIKAGAKVEKFVNGKLALDYLINHPTDNIHCVITDIEMPVMDGLTLTKQIKTNPSLKGIPVVLFSSIVSESLKHQGESVGADAQVTKPEIDKLVGIVKHIREKG